VAAVAAADPVAATSADDQAADGDDPGDQRSRRIIRWITTAAVIVVAACAARSAYEHQRTDVEMAGEHDSAWYLPLSVDGMMLIASLNMLVRCWDARKPAGSPDRPPPRRHRLPGSQHHRRPTHLDRPPRRRREPPLPHRLLRASHATAPDPVRTHRAPLDRPGWSPAAAGDHALDRVPGDVRASSRPQSRPDRTDLQ